MPSVELTASERWAARALLVDTKRATGGIQKAHAAMQQAQQHAGLVNAKLLEFGGAVAEAHGEELPDGVRPKLAMIEDGMGMELSWEGDAMQELERQAAAARLCPPFADASGVENGKVAAEALLAETTLEEDAKLEAELKAVAERARAYERQARFENQEEPVGPDSFGGSDESSHYMSQTAARDLVPGGTVGLSLVEADRPE